jgi:cell wall-associated NlpC family hydrolase
MEATVGTKGTANGARTRRWLSAAVLALVTGVGLQLLPSAATAAPAGRPPKTPAEATAMAQQTAQQLTGLDEQIQQAEATVADQQKAASAAATQADATQAALSAYEPRLRAIAQSGFTGSSQSRVAAFLTSNSARDLVQQLTTLDVIASRTEAVLAQVAAAQQAADQAKGVADVAAAKAAASLTTLQAQKKQLQSQVSTYQASFTRLTSAQQATVTNSLAGPTLSASASSLPSAPSATIARIIKTALAQVGKPYVFGATGPNGFDCSGLTSFAFAAAGMDIPHTSKGQSGMGASVSRADLRPGDLVFFYSPVSHVGLYLGNGMMVHARTFGKPVAVTSVDQSGYAFAKRLIP